MSDIPLQDAGGELPLALSIAMAKRDPKAAKAAFHATAAAFCPHCGKHHRVITPEQCADRRMSERVLQDRVVGRAKTRGWKVAHAGRGIAAFDAEGKPVFVTPMSKGWPDLFLVNVGQRRAMAIELKREQGELEPEQIEWLQLLNICGIPAVVIRPSDLREGRVNAILGRQ
jgi:hypothetical protein